MSRTQRMLARRWRPVLLACVLVALAGAVVAIWARIDHESGRAEQLAAEADRRGSAVTTLAGDVRTLRAQIQAKGGKPKAPDPSRAVADLKDRARVPVPIPGPAGEKGDPGDPGSAGDDGRAGDNGQDGRAGNDGQAGQDGNDGQAGQDGAEGPPGPQGEAGQDGQDGRDGEQGPRGEQGPAGPSCPDGYSLQEATLEPGALVCKRSSGGGPSPQGGRGDPVAVVDRKRW